MIMSARGKWRFVVSVLVRPRRLLKPKAGMTDGSQYLIGRLLHWLPKLGRLSSFNRDRQFQGIREINQHMPRPPTFALIGKILFSAQALVRRPLVPLF